MYAEATHEHWHSYLGGLQREGGRRLARAFAAIEAQLGEGRERHACHHSHEVGDAQAHVHSYCHDHPRGDASPDDREHAHRHEGRHARERFDPRELWLAMSGGSGEGGPHGHGRYGPGHGPGQWGRGFPFGGFGPGGPRGRGRGRKARRGDMRTAALLLLAEGRRNGYQMMQEVEERSGGVWRPSPGSVYPALQQLEDEGLIRSVEADGRKLYELTDDGRSVLAQRAEGTRAPWEEMSSDFGEGAFELGNMMKEVGFAFTQVMRTGGDAQIGEARKVLSAARRDLYRILADGEEGGSERTED
ncbi:MAG: PadR family transcriptional regulator [Solirubrobacteraceae bacterium]